jgi:hypothetical protein
LREGHNASGATRTAGCGTVDSPQVIIEPEAVLRRYVFVKLKPEHAEELKILQLQKMAHDTLHAAYGVQAVHVGRAMDDATRAEWDLCITVELVSSVDLARCLKDTVTRAFLERYLAERSERLHVGTFEGKLSGPRRA